jgi:hypothetical protein
MFTYRLHLEDRSDAGEATYAVMVKPGEEILVGHGEAVPPAHLVPFEEEDGAPFVGMLKVEAV